MHAGERHRVLLLGVEACHLSCVQELIFSGWYHVRDRADPRIRPKVVVLVVGRLSEAFARQCIMVTLRCGLV